MVVKFEVRMDLASQISRQNVKNSPARQIKFGVGIEIPSNLLFRRGRQSIFASTRGITRISLQQQQKGHCITPGILTRPQKARPRFSSHSGLS